MYNDIYYLVYHVNIFHLSKPLVDNGCTMLHIVLIHNPYTFV